MIESPKILQTVEQISAVIHQTVPRDEIRLVMGPAIEEIVAALKDQGVKPTGPLFTFHWKRPIETFDFEVGFPINEQIKPVGRVSMSQLPATKVVRTIYHGDYEGLAAAWGQFCEWIEIEKLNVQESLWETYLVGPESSPDPNQWCTELNRPLALKITSL